MHDGPPLPGIGFQTGNLRYQHFYLTEVVVNLFSGESDRSRDRVAPVKTDNLLKQVALTLPPRNAES